MQLGELQNQIARFERRGVSVVALSVDEPMESQALARRLGLSLLLGSDREQRVIEGFRVQNPDTQALALHAVYIVDETGRIFYRKVARRRPVSNELIDAIDAHRGVYPQTDPVEPRRRITVAFPDNNFQALLEVTRVGGLPQRIDTKAFARVQTLAQQLHSDDALIAFRTLMETSRDASQEELMDTAAWLARTTYFPETHAALETGATLRTRLDAVATLEAQLAATEDADERDALLETLKNARALLTRSRAVVEEKAQTWRLRLLKTSIRAYREVARAAYRNR